MRLLKKLLFGLASLAVVTGIGGYATYKYMNRTPAQLVAPDYYEYYLNQDTVPEGRVGIFISSLIMPEDYRIEDYFLLAQKARQYIPWPINIQWIADRGVLLLDPERPYEFEQFAPKRLVDAWGRDTDLDGLPYADKLATGEVEWVPPNPRLHLDHGYFLLKARQEGMPTVSAKLATKALTYYYGIGIKGHKIPHEAGMRAIVEPAMQEIQTRHGPIAWRWVTADNFGLARKAMHELLDTGVDTVLLAAPAPIYSHHEEFNGSIRHAMHYIHEWQEEHGHKPIKVIIQPQLGDFTVLRQTWLNMLHDRLDQLPKGVAVKVVMSIHGMAWDRVPNEAWIKLAPAYRDTTLQDLKGLLDSYD